MDYDDKELDELVTNYFKRKKIKNFKIEDVRLQITGKFKTNKK
jgi:Fur family peroxide stress response transcriptional regulator